MEVSTSTANLWLKPLTSAWNRYLQFPEDQNPKLQVSLLRVALMVARGLPEALREEYFTEVCIPPPCA